jgi:hypothetical protein
LDAKSAHGRSTPLARPSKHASYLGLFRHLQGIIDLDTQIANGTFQFGVPEQQLDSTQILGPPVDQRSFGSTRGVSSVRRSVQADLGYPAMNYPRILPSGQVR